MKLSVDFPVTVIVALLSVAILLIGSEVTTATSSTARKREEEEQQHKGKSPSLHGVQQLDALNSDKLDELRPSSPSVSFDDDVDAAHTASASASTSADTGATSGDCSSITDTVCAMEGVTVFCELVDFASAFGFDDDSEEFTLFVPTDAAFSKISDAFETLSDAEASRVVMFHMYQGMILTSDKLECSEKITSMNENGDASRTKCTSDGKKYQNGNGNTKTGTMPEIDTADNMACNGVVHTLDYVMFPVSLFQLHAASSASEVNAMSFSLDESDDVAPIAPTNDDERIMILSNETVSDDFLNNETDSLEFDFAEEEDDGTVISNYSLLGPTSKSMKSGKSAKKSKGSMRDNVTDDDFIDFASDEDGILSNNSLSLSRSKSGKSSKSAKGPTNAPTNAPIYCHRR